MCQRRKTSMLLRSQFSFLPSKSMIYPNQTASFYLNILERWLISALLDQNCPWMMSRMSLFEDSRTIHYWYWLRMEPRTRSMLRISWPLWGGDCRHCEHRRRLLQVRQISSSGEEWSRQTVPSSLWLRRYSKPVKGVPSFSRTLLCDLFQYITSARNNNDYPLYNTHPYPISLFPSSLLPYLYNKPQLIQMAKAPDRGSFPLDHFHECDEHAKKYSDCVVRHQLIPKRCRDYQVKYLLCRMQSGLMEQEEMAKLGFLESNSWETEDAEKRALFEQINTIKRDAWKTVVDQNKDKPKVPSMPNNGPQL